MALPATLETDDSLGLTQERFGFTVFLSVCVHVIIILGVGFTFTADPRPATSLEITLATYQSAEAPDDADFLAQANQQGSGSEEQTLAPASPVDSPFADEHIQDINKFLQERPAQAASAPSDDIVATPAQNGPAPDQQADNLVADLPEVNNLDAPDLNDRIASLRAQLDLHRQEYAKRPRRYTITSASTREADDALYLDNWRKRIESVGNQNYPQEATTQGIYGTLRLMVAIRPDGSIDDIRILRSSGERLLDEAAIHIVQLAAPFDAFSDEMRSRVDILEVIRTWQFQRGNTFSSF